MNDTTNIPLLENHIGTQNIENDVLKLQGILTMNPIGTGKQTLHLHIHFSDTLIGNEIDTHITPRKTGAKECFVLQAPQIP